MSDPVSIELSVIICTFNRADLLGPALESLAGQTLEPSRMEVVVVDNNSTDSPCDVVDRFRGKILNLRYLTEDRQGLSHARNLGWRSAKGEFVAFLDDDARAATDWCERIVTAFRTVTPVPVSVGGKILPVFNGALPAWFTPEIEIRSWGETPCFLDGPRTCYGFSGSNMSFPREVLARYGGFSPGLGMQGDRIRLGEDSHLYNRIQEHEPLFWYDPHLVVHHLVPPRNLRLRYRLSRAYASGASVAFMRRERGESFSLRDELPNTLYLFKEFLRVLVFQWSNRTEQFRKLSDLVKQAGMLSGR
jgi:glycosyltransferase involved in cell wall biosynthesis